MKSRSQSSLTLFHGTSGEWEGTFQVLLTTLLEDIMQDGPTDIALTLADGPEVSGTLLSHDDNFVIVDTIGGGLQIDRENILAFTLI